MRVHSIADIFPRMSAAEYAALRDDIQKNGQREPIWVWKGQIIDGRHRAQACEELGIEPAAREYDGEESTLVAFVVSLNLHRRHLDESQRAMVFARLATLPKGANQHTAIAAPTQAQAAKLLNISVDSGQRARRVLDQGAPELVAAVDRGEVSVSAAASVASLPQEIQQDIVATGPEEVVEVAKTIRAAPHVSHNSGNNEWYTPQEYIDAAVATMGRIDLDPASSEVANRRVGAERFYTAADNGLAQKWHGNVWMNPPYAQPLISEFAAALVSKYQSREIEQACVLVNNATDTGWFRLLAEASSATCFTKGRVRFIDPDGNPSGAPLQGQAVLYFGGNADDFAREFRKLGYVFVGKPVALAA